MDPRYQHPQVSTLWDREWTLGAWWRIEQAAVRAQIKHGVIPVEHAWEAEVLLSDTQPMFNGATLANIAYHEETTRHDVAAFLAEMREWYDEPHARWIHFGLTSSDIVDTAQALRFKAVGITYRATAERLRHAVMNWTNDPTIVLGRTHGQPAEPTSMGVRAMHWLQLINPATFELERATRSMETGKLSGPVGTFAHNPIEVENDAMAELGLLGVGYGSSQIVPRGTLARWANCAAELVHACAKVAMDLRLLNLLGEVEEPLQRGQVASSSMAHKQNPIRAEQITGMQRLAAGYASMLQPLDLWLERDISNSSVERVAVPDLWHVLLHVMEQTATLLDRTHLHPREIQENIDAARGAPFVSMLTNQAIASGLSVESAREQGIQDAMLVAPGDLRWHLRNWLGRTAVQ